MPGHSRHLDWEGCFNARDLGGLSTPDGGATRWGAAVRADALDRLTEAGWRCLWEHGVRTVIDLRNPDERRADSAPRPSGIATVRIPLDVTEDREFWRSWESGPQFGTPLYYAPHLERFPERNAAVIGAVANAAPGGVAFHCEGGRDRAGQVAMLLLALAGVRAEEIAADYALSFERLPGPRGAEDPGPELRAFLRERGTTAEALILELLASLDVEAYMRSAGLSEGRIARLRERLLDDQPPERLI